MKYFSSNDYQLQYNKTQVNNKIATAENTIYDICKRIDSLEFYLTELENSAHDKANTRVDEDYKDFEKLFGYSCLTGLLQTISYHLDDLKSEMSQYEQTVNANIERRRREEEEKRKRNEHRLKSFRY